MIGESLRTGFELGYGGGRATGPATMIRNILKRHDEMASMAGQYGMKRASEDTYGGPDTLSNQDVEVFEQGGKKFYRTKVPMQIGGKIIYKWDVKPLNDSLANQIAGALYGPGGGGNNQGGGGSGPVNSEFSVGGGGGGGDDLEAIRQEIQRRQPR